MKHNPKHFTPFEIELLRQNPNTYSVTPRVLSFTAEFKRLYWERYQAGDAVAQIFEDAGYDPLVVGYTRMHSFAQNLRKVVREGREFREFGARSSLRPANSPRDKPENEVTSSSGSSKPSGKRTANRNSADIERMYHEIVYLRQHVEFLKKIIETDKSSKPGD